MEEIFNQLELDTLKEFEQKTIEMAKATYPRPMTEQEAAENRAGFPKMRIEIYHIDDKYGFTLYDCNGERLMRSKLFPTEPIAVEMVAIITEAMREEFIIDKSDLEDE